VSVDEEQSKVQLLEDDTALTILPLSPSRLCSAPIQRQMGDKALPVKLQQQLLDMALSNAEKRGEEGVTRKHLDAYAFDGKKNIFSAVKFAFPEHTFITELPGRNGGNDRRIFSVSAETRECHIKTTH
jgi:hypothetical protein